MRRWFLRLLLSLFAWQALAGGAFAQGVQTVPPLNGRVEDRTATLSAAQLSALTAKLAAIETRSGSQVVVLMVDTTQPEDITAYAQRVAAQWKLGRREVGDGLLIVVAKGDRRARLEVAKALEGAVPDLAASRVIEQQMMPAFRNADYAGGLNAAVDRLALLIANEALPAPSANERDASPRGAPWNELTMFFFVGVPVVGGILSAMLGRRLGSLVTGMGAGGVAWWLTTSVLLAGAAGVVALLLVGVAGVGAGRSFQGGRRYGGGGIGGFGGGFGGGSGGGGGGGGFSSGGGGDFGGGGASGRW